MPALLNRLITAEEFDRELVHRDGIELVSGIVVPTVSTDPTKGMVCVNVASILGEFVKRHKLGYVMSDGTSIRTGPRTVLSSDICFLSYDQHPKDRPLPLGMVVPPCDLVVHIKAECQGMNELCEKSHRYLEAGVRWVMLINPDDETATVMHYVAETQIFTAAETLRIFDILPGFAVRVGEFFE